MADISQYLQAIMSAVYGEDVRGSIHDAIALINDVGETVLTLGTAVTGPTSPTTGFYRDSVYINTDTDDMWVCTGTGWSNKGTIKGAKGDDGDSATIAVGTVTAGDVASVVNTGTASAAVFDFVLPKGDKGDTGDSLTANSSHSGTNTTVNILNASTSALINSFQVPDGAQGPSGNGISSITKIGTSGLVDTYQISFTDGTTFTYQVTNGQDGQGSGDMTKLVYDATNAVADAGGIAAYVTAHAGTTYTGEKGVVVAGTTIKAALMNDSPSSLASANISTTQNRQYAVGLDSNSKLSVNVPWENTTYSAATTSADGLMSSTDKSKLDGIEAGANAYTLPTASTSTLGGIKPDGTTITVDASTGVASAVGGSGTVDQTYNPLSTNAQSGTAVAGAISSKADSTDLDGWTATSTVSSFNTVTFNGLDDSYGYDLYCSDKLIQIKSMVKTGSGTSVSLTYGVSGAAIGDVCKLRILK